MKSMWASGWVDTGERVGVGENSEFMWLAYPCFHARISTSKWGINPEGILERRGPSLSSLYLGLCLFVDNTGIRVVYEPIPWVGYWLPHFNYPRLRGEIPLWAGFFWVSDHVFGGESSESWDVFLFFWVDKATTIMIWILNRPVPDLGLS